MMEKWKIVTGYRVAGYGLRVSCYEVASCGLASQNHLSPLISEKKAALGRPF
jgi:hypothetical protein